MRIRDCGDAQADVRSPAPRESERVPRALRDRDPTAKESHVMNIAIPIFDRLTALDAVGPYEVLSRLPGARVQFLAAEPGPKRTETEMLALTADGALADLPDPDVVMVPGGFGTRDLMDDQEMLDWLRGAHSTSE